MLKDDLSGVRERAGAVLFGIGEPVLPHLLAAATDPDAFVRVEVVGALGECAEGHPELLGTISHLARDPDLDVRVQALVALGRFGADATPVLLKALNDKEPRILDAALAALVRIAPRESSAVPLLVKLLGHTEYTVRWHAADVLAVMGEAAKPAIPALVRCLSHESVHMRMSVADALQKLEDLAIPAVIDGLDDATPEGQQAALVLLLKQEKTSDEIRGAYVRMLASKSTSVRVHAAAAMARTRVPNDSVLPTLLAGLQSKDK